MTTPPPIPAESPEILWYYTDANNQPQGPVSSEELKRLTAAGRITPETPLARAGDDEWKKASETAPEIFATAPPISQKSQRLPVILALVFFWPYGLYRLWKSDSFSENAKVRTTALFVVLAVLGILCELLGKYTAIPVGLIAGTLLWKSTATKRTKQIGIGAIALIALVVLASDSEKIPLTDTRHDSSFQKSEKPNAVKQYETFRLGDFSYMINECETRDSIGAGYMRRTMASSGAAFLLVHFTILNESMKTQTVAADDFLIRDAKGREFRPSSKANTALMMAGKQDDFLIRELQPGIEKESITAFELPEDVLDSSLFLVVPEKGVFGRKHVIVKITAD